MSSAPEIPRRFTRRESIALGAALTGWWLAGCSPAPAPPRGPLARLARTLSTQIPACRSPRAAARYLHPLPLPATPQWPPDPRAQKAIQHRIREDFRTGRYTVASGWLISHTEAAYLVLLHQATAAS